MTANIEKDVKLQNSLTSPVPQNLTPFVYKLYFQCFAVIDLELAVNY